MPFRVPPIWMALLCCLFTASVGAVAPIEPLPFWQTSEYDMYSTGMVWRDLNNDGFIDVLYSNGNDIVMAPNTVYLSEYGVLPAAASWSSTNSEYTGHCAVGDIDDDGWADFAVANFLGAGRFATPNLSNIYNNNAGALSASPDWYTEDSMYTFSCAFGDVDGDGDLDLAFATGEPYNDMTIQDRIYYNVDGVLETSPGWYSANATQAMDVAWGDIDNDGDLDLAFCYDDRPPALYYNQGSYLETLPSWSALENESANTIVFGDVNGDGWLDLVVAFNNQLGGSGRYRVYYNQGNGTLNTTYGWQSATGGFGSALALYDYDNDGDLDLAAGRWFDRPRIYQNLGTAFTITPVWEADNSTVVETIAWVDLDGNGLEQMADTITDVSGKKVFYTAHMPLYSLDSVAVDGAVLPLDAYCYDPFYGWVSLAAEPSTDIVIYSQYSFTNDVATSNWDTYNMLYANTATPPLRIYADPAIGFAPLTVQFGDSSTGASAWYWDFGDDETSLAPTPEHTYTSTGIFDVRLTATLPDGNHTRLNRHMVITLADTLYFDDVLAHLGDTVKIPVYLKNAHDLTGFVISVSHAGSLNLLYSGFDTVGCRTAGFTAVHPLGINPTADKLAFEFIAAEPLPPGDGKIITLHFAPPASGGQAILDTTTTGTDATMMDGGFFAYAPAVRTATATVTTCGDVDADGRVIISDAVYLINYIFKGGPPPILVENSDVNCDGYVNVGDVVYLIYYVFRSGPPPCCL